MLLHREAVPVAHGARTRVCAVGVQNASFACICEVRRQNFVADSPRDSRIFDRKHRLDAFVEVARHPVGAAEIQLGLAAILEEIDAAVFEEAADDAADLDPATESANSGDQRALAAYEQIDVHARL